MQKREAKARNVLIVIPSIDREGITTVVARQINGFIKKGTTPYLLVIGPFRESVLSELTCDLPKQYILRLNQPHSFLSLPALFSIFKLINPVIKFIHKHDIKFVIAHAPYAHFLIRLVSLWAKKESRNFKLIAYFHSLQYKEFPLKKISRVIFNHLNQRLARKYDNAHVFVSEAVRADVEEGLFKHENQKVLYSPMMLCNATDGSENNILLKPSADFIILLPGRLETNKGQLFFLRILIELINREQLEPKDISVILVGDGIEKKNIERFIADNCLKDFVSLIGQVSPNVLHQSMKQANLIVIPSYLEGMSLIALEALQLEALILASDTGGLKEIIKQGETGYLFKAGDDIDCYKKLRTLFMDRENIHIDQSVVKHDLQERFAFDSYIHNLVQFVYQI